ncbi:hypothetical protein DES39_0763 [Orbus hercynius]|uniref:Putative phosphoenolpyruvate synthase regulatory protein n=1 Tax=Orbus hercynius TaxID=593135 RepID=A0A495RL58_9GAMM|nr:pyruvate, water dikinase regulatory protein [Orbus hercynius]RKS87528.1 hypothetical protein DES39_0763 [Orbus hercynius]
MDCKRTVFFISDRTGVTVENLGHSLLNQFEGVALDCFTVPFVDSVERSHAVLNKINIIASLTQQQVIVISSLVNPELRALFDHHDHIVHMDFFSTFMPPLEQALNMRARMIAGLTHGIADERRYDERMEAVNFALSNDDGITEKNYHAADIILIGVSRSGKTPTCLYLALQYGILAANYPLTQDDLDHNQIPKMIAPYRDKLFGLTIDYKRLSRIREERRPHSKYANPLNCDFEVRTAESLFKRYNIPNLSTTNRSVEELAAAIMQMKNLSRRS